MDFLYCDHQSVGLIDSLAVFLPPVILTKVLILGLVPQKCPPIYFSLLKENFRLASVLCTPFLLFFYLVAFIFNMMSFQTLPVFENFT